MRHIQRVLALTLVLIVMVPLSYIAARWQLDRHQQRDSQNELLQNARSEEPKLIENLPEAPEEFSRVIIQGILEDDQVLWRRQVLNGIPGFIVLRNVILVDGTSVTVALGWTSSPTITAMYNIEFPILGYVRYPQSEGISPADVPEGQINFVTEMMEKSQYPFYVQSKNASTNLSQLSLPEVSSGPHLGYVGQWILIGIASVAIYIVALRRIRADYASEIRS